MANGSSSDHVYTVVSGIEHEDCLANAVDGPRILQFAFAAADTAVHATALPVAAETLDPVVAEFADEQRSVIEHHHIIRVGQLAKSASGTADRAEDQALRVDHNDPVVARVGDEQFR